ncbi:uncharacterized protein RJT20DRAFT_146301 [Scheffersomyces xylosifermentans]|uniref:uncharacterized protein n=1 Tax=Scheffersomyces xylosifermentans TaxID=1304137 RepID=UPI00315DE3CA
MPELTNDVVKLNRLHTNPKKGHKLGTASATWKKIKSAAAVSAKSAPYSPEEPDSKDNNGVIKPDKPSVTTNDKSTLIEYGSHGEIFIAYPSTRTVQLWDWKPPSSDTKKDAETLYLNGQIHLDSGVNYDTDSLVNFKILKEPTDRSSSSQYSILALMKTHSGAYKLTNFRVDFATRSLPFSDSVTLPTLFYNCPSESDSVTFTLKTSNKFIVVANSEGLLCVYKYSMARDAILMGNSEYSLQDIRKQSSQPILSKYNILSKFPDDQIILQTSCNQDNEPIFDIVDNWLVYSPTKFEYKHMKAISSTTPIPTSNESVDPIIVSSSSTNEAATKQNSLYTPVKLPASGPLLNKVLSTLSNTALDGLFRLSEISSSKVKSYLNNKGSKQELYKAPTINSISKSIGNLLYSTASSTASTLESSTRSLKPNNNQLLKILDLSNDKVLGVFKPLGGVSNVSLSPYDSQLVHSSLRGDTLFMWDLYRLPSEISLIGKFTRGKTSAVIEEIFWFNNNYGEGNGHNSGNSGNPNDSSIKGNNSGFGCITKSTGSVHWFNINYLSGNMNNNFPNSLNKEKVKRDHQSGSFLDSWILSSLKAKKFVALPDFNGLTTSISNSGNSSNVVTKSNDVNHINRVTNQLAIIDDQNQLKLISTLNGSHLYKYELPNQPVDSKYVPRIFHKLSNENEKGTKDLINPLSQAEIETSAPFLNLINNKNVEFAVYSFEDQSDSDGFMNAFKEFGNEIPDKVIKFESSALPDHHHHGKTLFDIKGASDDKPEDHLSLLNGLYIDQGEGSIESTNNG